MRWESRSLVGLRFAIDCEQNIIIRSKKPDSIENEQANNDSFLWDSLKEEKFDADDRNH